MTDEPWDRATPRPPHRGQGDPRTEVDLLRAATHSFGGIGASCPA